MRSLSRRSQHSVNTWPGFVDALATVLMVIIFLLMIFVIAQFFLTEALSGRDEALEDLGGQVNELADMLALERRTTENMRTDVEHLSQELQASVMSQDDLKTTVRALTTRSESAEDKAKSFFLKLTDEREKSLVQVGEINDLAGQVEALVALRDQLEDQVGDMVQKVQSTQSENADLTSSLVQRDDLIANQLEQLSGLALDIQNLKALKVELETDITSMASKMDATEGKLLTEKELSKSARAELALLNQHMDALRSQLSELAQVLDEADFKNEAQKAEIHLLGQRLNSALATKVQELSRYRSEFFGKLREILGNTEGVQIVGDRFVLQSELLFEQGSAEIGESGLAQVNHLADTLIEISKQIPDDLDWVLRVDGHTDAIPISTFKYPSNWELSSARAISVVKHLISKGLSPDHLVAAGFGEYQPIAAGSDSITMRQNRRIELKLTQR